MSTEQDKAAPKPAEFPAEIWDMLLEVADRTVTEIKSPWEGPDGKPLQDDADAAIAWIKAHAAKPKEPAQAAVPADVARLIDDLEALAREIETTHYPDAILSAVNELQRMSALLAAQPKAELVQPADSEFRDAQEMPFKSWWEREGQFLRSGGTDYAKTFAWHAWIEAKSHPAPAQAPLTDEQIAKAQGDCFNWLAEHTGYTGGMGGETWDRESGRAVMHECAAAWGVKLDKEQAR